jgi:hypothetical protein
MLLIELHWRAQKIHQAAKLAQKFKIFQQFYG